MIVLLKEELSTGMRGWSSRFCKMGELSGLKKERYWIHICHCYDKIAYEIREPQVIDFVQDELQAIVTI